MIVLGDRPPARLLREFGSRAVLGSLILGTLLLFSSCATVVAGAGLPRTASAASYLTLYRGLVKPAVVPPPLLAETSLAALQVDFPATSPTQLHHELRGLGPQLYLGLTLSRVSCRDDYLAHVTDGPGALLTLTVAVHQLPPRSACFELIGPVMYQVLALPLKRFPRQLTLSIVVKRPSGSPADQVSVRLP
ncbi:MAG: hypothetical protein WBR23_00085 [Candidatus Dormiibacterota bacterium]